MWKCRVLDVCNLLLYVKLDYHATFDKGPSNTTMLAHNMKNNINIFCLRIIKVISLTAL